MIKIAKKRKPKAGTGGSLARGGGSLKKGLKKNGQLRSTHIPSKKAKKKTKQKEAYLVSLKREREMAERGWKVVRTKTYLEKPKKAIGKKGYPYAVLNKNNHYESFYTWKEKTSKKKWI